MPPKTRWKRCAQADDHRDRAHRVPGQELPYHLSHCSLTRPHARAPSVNNVTGGTFAWLSALRVPRPGTEAGRCSRHQRDAGEPAATRKAGVEGWIRENDRVSRYPAVGQSPTLPNRPDRATLGSQQRPRRPELRFPNRNIDSNRFGLIKQAGSLLHNTTSPSWAVPPGSRWKGCTGTQLCSRRKKLVPGTRVAQPIRADGPVGASPHADDPRDHAERLTAWSGPSRSSPPPSRSPRW